MSWFNSNKMLLLTDLLEYLKTQLEKILLKWGTSYWYNIDGSSLLLVNTIYIVWNATGWYKNYPSNYLLRTSNLYKVNRDSTVSDY